MVLLLFREFPEVLFKVARPQGVLFRQYLETNLEFGGIWEGCRMIEQYGGRDVRVHVICRFRPWGRKQIAHIRLAYRSRQ